MAYKTLLVEESDGVLLVTLNRPEVQNAINEGLIADAIELFRGVGQRSVRAVVLRGSGSNFCAGADLNWMSQMVRYTREQNIRDSANLAQMYATINECPLPVIGRVQGAGTGGGVGLVAACDVVVCTRDAKFGLAEVKLGILPAVISPYVIAKIGQTHARALVRTRERFEAERAPRVGLVHRIADDPAALEAAVNEIVEQIKTSGPQAVRECKKLIAHVAAHEIIDSVPYTIEAIATRRVSDEGQAGMNAFLKKEKPPWVSKN